MKTDESCSKCGHSLRLTRAIEVGHIFKLGTKYSQAMGAVFLDVNGVEKPIVMGSYGIGVGRLVASVIESSHDEHGIIWPRSVTPYDVIIITLNPSDIEIFEISQSLYNTLQEKGLSVLWDERDARPGVKFNDADLIGLPIRLTVGDRNLKDGLVEIKRRDQDKTQKRLIPLKSVLEVIQEEIDTLKAEVVSRVVEVPYEE